MEKIAQCLQELGLADMNLLVKLLYLSVSSRHYLPKQTDSKLILDEVSLPLCLSQYLIIEFPEKKFCLSIMSNVLFIFLGIVAGPIHVFWATLNKTLSFIYDQRVIIDLAT